MNGTVVTAVVFSIALATGVVAAVVRLARRRRNSTVEDRGRRAIMNLAIDRGRRQVWGAASVGIIAGGSGIGGGCGGAGGGGCGAGCGGGCGG
jgi:hypothetical protein